MARRRLTWVRTLNIGQVLPAAASGAAVDLFNGYRADMGITRNLPGTTVARVRAAFFIAGLSAGTSPIWVGLRKSTIQETLEAQTDPVFGLNSAPNRAEGADWAFWSALYPNHGSDPTTGIPNAATYEFDVKAMRKLDEIDETYSFFAGKETSTAGVTVNATFSVLLMQP